MAMRSTGGGAASSRRPPRSGGGGGVREVYEDFRPVSEWQQDDESHILIIYLPGFMKEQIKVSTEGRNTIRVRGERLVAGNKWNRFLEEFQVPENGKMNSVRAKYQGGILTITIPKTKIDKPQDALPSKIQDTGFQKQPIPQKGEAPESSTSSQATDGKRTEPQSSSTDPTTKHNQVSDASTQKDQDKASSASQSTEKKSVAEPQTDQDGDQRRRGRISPLRSKETAVAQDTGKRESSQESKEKHIAADHVTNKAGDYEGKDIVSSKEIPEVETAKKTKTEKDAATVIPEKNADNKELNAAFTKEKYKAAVKGLTELNEERQLLVNMGAALLVIVALTAYVTYSFASAKDKS